MKNELGTFREIKKVELYQNDGKGVYRGVDYGLRSTFVVELQHIYGTEEDLENLYDLWRVARKLYPINEKFRDEFSKLLRDFYNEAFKKIVDKEEIAEVKRILKLAFDIETDLETYKEIDAKYFSHEAHLFNVSNYFYYYRESRYLVRFIGKLEELIKRYKEI